VWGPVQARLVAIQNLPYEYLGPELGYGQARDLTFNDLVVKELPGQPSIIDGLDDTNTSHHIAFDNLVIVDEIVSTRNHATYFNVGENTYDISFGGRNVVTAVDVCNMALGLIGNKAKVTDIDPSDGSAEADHCVRFYPQAIRAILEMHNWSFAKRKRVLTVVNADPDDTDDPAWQYRYQLPDDWVKTIAVLSEDATNDYMIADTKVPVDHDVKYSEDDAQLRLYTNQEDAWLRYIYYEDDPNQWSHLFMQAVVWHLASMLAGPIIKGAEGHTEAQRCLQRMGAYLGEARIKDGMDRQATVTKKASWIAGR
jgi:hypothetical protein